MTDYNVLIISLVATLLASAIPQFLYWRNSKEADRKKRGWQLADVLREKEIQVIEERTKEIDKLANALAISFHEKRLSLIQFVSFTDEEKNERIPDYFYDSIVNISDLQKEFYAITPMIISLGHKTDKLVQCWEDLTQIDANLIQLIIVETKRENWDDQDIKRVNQTLNEIKTEFNNVMSKFYDEIDSFRINSVEEQIRFASYD